MSGSERQIGLAEEFVFSSLKGASGDLHERGYGGGGQRLICERAVRRPPRKNTTSGFRRLEARSVKGKEAVKREMTFADKGSPAPGLLYR